MDRLHSTENGGIPLEWDDLRWEAKSVRDAFNHLLKGIGIAGDANFILYGCVAGGGNITAGAVVINGEICFVAAQAIPAPAPDKFFQIQETDDPSGIELMQNGATTNQYKLRFAVLVAGVAPVGAFDENGPDMKDLITDKAMGKASSAYIIVNGDVSYNAGAGNSASGTIRYKKIGKFYLLNISFVCTITTPPNSIDLSIATLLALAGDTPASVVQTVGYVQNPGAFAVPMQACPFNNPIINFSKDWNLGTYPNGATFVRGQVWIEVV